MTRRFAPFVLIFALVAGCLPGPSSQNASSPGSSAAGDVVAGRTRESTIVEVQADVRRRIEALYRGDREALMPYVQRTLASEAFADQMAEADVLKAIQGEIDRFAALNADLESVAFPEPPKFAQTEERLYAIVPFKLVERYRATGERVQVVNFSTGVLEKGAEGFYYFDGAIPIDKIREKFPDLPAGYKYPDQSATPWAGASSSSSVVSGTSPAAEAAPPAGQTLEPRAVEVQNDVRRRMEALYQADKDALMVFGRRMLLGPVKNHFKTEEEVRESLRYEIEPFNSRLAKIESIDFPEPPRFFQTSERLYAFVPYSLVEKETTTGLRTRRVSYSIGMREPDADGFYYVDASAMPQGTEVLRQGFPDLPEDSQLPKSQLTPLPSDPSQGEFASISLAAELPPGTQRTYEAMETALQADIRKQVEALEAGDSLTLLRYLYGEELEGLRAEELLERLGLHVAMRQRLNVTVESVEFEPAKFVPGEKRLFAVVSYALIIRSDIDGRTRFRLPEVAVGVLDDGATQFGYIDGVSKYRLESYYPDVPPDVKIPRGDMEKLPN